MTRVLKALQTKSPYGAFTTINEVLLFMKAMLVCHLEGFA
jgi:hypothetical protein